MSDQSSTFDISSAWKSLGNIVTIAKGAGISFVGRLVGIALQYVFMAIAARELGSHDYGLLTLAITMVTLLGLVSLFGFDQGALRYVASYRGVNDRAGERGTVLLATVLVGCTSVAVVIVILGIAPDIAAAFSTHAEFVPFLRLFVLSVPFLAFLTLFGAITDARKKMQYRVIASNIFQPAVAVVVFIVLLFAGWHLWGAAVAYVLSLLIAAGVAFYFVRTYFFEDSSISTPRFELHSLLKFSSPLFMSNILQRTSNQLEIYLLGLLETPDAVGIFSVAARTAALGTIALTSLNKIFAPMISDLSNQGEDVELDRMLKLVTRWSILFGVPPLFIMWLFAQPILLVFGSDFTAGSSALLILAIGQFINCATGSVGVALAMSGYPNLKLLNSATTVVLSLLLDIILIPRFGLVGAALGSGISLAAVNILRLLEVNFVLRLNPYDRRSFKPVLAGLMAAFTLWILQHLSLLGSDIWSIVSSIPIFGGLYVIGLYVMGIEEQDKMVIETSLSKVRAFWSEKHTIRRKTVQ